MKKTWCLVAGQRLAGDGRICAARAAPNAGVRQQSRHQRHVRNSIEPARFGEASGCRYQAIRRENGDGSPKDFERAQALVDSGKVKVTLPTALDANHQKMLDDLKAKSGKDFDTSYDQTQVKAHQEAVALFEAYAKSGDNSELKTWAAETLPHLKEHLSMAQKLK